MRISSSAITSRPGRASGVRWLLTLAFFVAAGCGPPVESVVFLPDPGSARAADHPIRIYRGTVPACPYEEVGLVVWEPRSPWSRLQRGVELMRVRAREMGGDAIVGFQLGEQTDGYTTTTQVRSDTTGTVRTRATGKINRSTFASGAVIRFTAAGCGPEAGADRRRDAGGAR